MSKKSKSGSQAKETPESIVHRAASSPIPRLVPMAAGLRVMFFDPLDLTGRAYEIQTDDERDTFADAIRETCAMGLSYRIRAELEEFVKLYPDGLWAILLDHLENEDIL